jgi:RNA polymerase subunit RPABC4/transcription elongation factor Spt4
MASQEETCTMHHRFFKLPLLLLGLFALSGCSAPIFAGMTFAELTTAGSLISTAATGKGLSEYALDAATGRDCRIVEAMVRDDRRLCERKNSPALAKDWKGLASLDDEAHVAPETDPGSEPRNRWDG